MIKTECKKILISVIAAIGLFSLAGCGGGGPSEKDVAGVSAERMSAITMAMESNPMMAVLLQEKPDEGKQMIAMSMIPEGIPLDVENDKIVEQWDLLVIAKGSPIKNSGLREVTVSVGSGKYSASASTVGASEIPAGTKLYPVIYKLVSKDKQHEGMPLEMYFYKDAYKKWAAAKPEDVGMQPSAAHVKLILEYDQGIDAKRKAIREGPRGVVDTWLKCLKEGNAGGPNAIQYVSADHKDTFLKKSLGGMFDLPEIRDERLIPYKPMPPGIRDERFDSNFKYDRSGTLNERLAKLKETFSKIEIISTDIKKESAEVTLSGDKVIGLKNEGGKWLITSTPQFFEEFNKDEGIPKALVSTFCGNMLYGDGAYGAIYSSTDHGIVGILDIITDRVKNDYGHESISLKENFEQLFGQKLFEFATPEYKDILVKEILGDVKNKLQSLTAPFPQRPEYYDNPSMAGTQLALKHNLNSFSDEVKEAEQKARKEREEYDNLIRQRQRDEESLRKMVKQAIQGHFGEGRKEYSEEIRNESAKVTMPSGKTASLKKVDGKWLITGIQ